MFGIHVDPVAAQPAFELAAEVLGLVPESRARRLVRLAEEAYRARDLDAVMALFHPDAIVRWNGQRVASGADEVRRFHVERLGFGEDRTRDDEVTKTVRVADGDTIAVEWTSSTRAGADLLTLRGDLHRRVARVHSGT